MTVRDLLGPGGALSRVLSAYEPRDEQLAMAQAVEHALDAREHLLVEAGTGTGKSLAYLVPAVRSGLRVVVSTATKALGEQILLRDVPTLERLGLSVRVALVKGLGNYVCLRRLEEHRRAAGPLGTRLDAHLPTVLDWLDHSDTGDRADLATIPDDASTWREITSSSDTRVGPRCSYHEQCFVTRMKRRAEAAQIVLTNHHLFFADLALRASGSGAQALPDYDVVIFDEAHALEEVATEFFGVRVTRVRVETLARDAHRALEPPEVFSDPLRVVRVNACIGALRGAAEALFAVLPRAGSDGQNGARVRLTAEHWDGPMGPAARALDAALGELAGEVAAYEQPGDAVISVARRLRAMREALSVLRDSESHAHVAFAESEGRGGGALGACPVDVGALLRERLWPNGATVILTSATLSIAGSTGFRFVRERLGVPDEAAELQLESPFDFGGQSALYIPRDIPEPREAGYLDIALDHIVSLTHITGGGAFVLCTSVRQMRAFGHALRERWDRPTLIQGDAPKNVLLACFREHGDAVLVATSSFWQGVDVPGRALRLVVIDKLPFDAPTEPVVAARIQNLRERGGEPFREYQLPAAALALKQGFGRLIRTRDDVGIVAILDRRLVTKGYGRTLIAALPPASRCASLDELRAFWEHVTARA